MEFFLNRRKVLLNAAAAVAALAAGGATHAASWPDKPITVIIPAPAGSSIDQNMRRATEEMAKFLKQSIVIDNRPGGGGAIALPVVARAAPDGYTLGIGNTASMVITPEINSKVRYDPLKDFEFIARFTHQPNVLVVKNELPVKTVAELTQYLKKNPGKLFLGSQGNGSTGHLSGEMYKKMAGTDFVHVPYRGSPQAVQDMLGGRVDLMFENMANIEGQIEAGKVRALAVTSAQRNPRFPDLPTMQEAGVAGYEVVSWAGLIAPVGTPKEVVARLSEALNAALKVREVNAFILSRGAVIDGGSPAAFKTFVAGERTKWQTLIKDIGGIAEDSPR